jgi:hypothetical protein
MNLQSQVTDTTMHKNSKETIEVAIPDSLLSIPLDLHGKLQNFGSVPSYLLNKKDLQTIVYRDFSDILYSKLPVYKLSLGNFGIFNSIYYLGLMPNNIDFSHNGRSILDKNFLSLNPSQISHEDFENLEFIEGFEAVVLSPLGSNVLINTQEKIFNTKNPYTRLWFSQAGFGHLASDGIYSANFAPNWNFTFGYKGQTAQGQFDNDYFSFWNVRLRLRWNPSNKTSISLNDNFTNHKSGISGGMNEKTSIDGSGNIYLYSPIYANQNLNEALERNYRHNVDLNLTSDLSDDSTSILNAGLYFSNILWRFEAPKEERIDTNSKEINEFRINQFGIFSKYAFRYLDFVQLNIGGELSYHNIPASDAWDSYKNAEYSVFGLANLFISDDIQLSGGLRQAYLLNNLNVSFGSKLLYNINDYSNSFIDFSYTEQSPSPAQGLDLNKADITSFLFAYNYRIPAYFIETKLAFRVFNSPIISKAVYREETIISAYSFNGDNKNIISGSLSTGINMLPDFMGDSDLLTLLMVLNYDKDNSNYKTVPEYQVKLGAKYDFTIGRSKLFSGINISFLPLFTGLRYIPQKRVYAILDTPTETKFKFNGIDAYVILKLGSAYVKLAMDNIMGQEYYYVPYYPALQRNFNLSFAWTFLD